MHFEFCVAVALSERMRSRRSIQFCPGLSYIDRSVVEIPKLEISRLRKSRDSQQQHRCHGRDKLTDTFHRDLLR